MTGGASGIGRAMAFAFARQGAPVGIVDRDTEGAAKTATAISADGGRAFAAPADVTDIQALRAAIASVAAAMGPIRVLINNAGNDQRHDFATLTSDYWDERMAVNLRHLAFAAQAVTPGMEAAGGGVIINLGSTSWMQGAAGLIAYGTAKAAIGGFTQCFARDLGPSGIRVMCIAPGRTMTERATAGGLDPDYEAQTLARQAVKTLVLPEDIANLALWLASDDARIMSGQTIIADGGHMMR
ncbi:SDR family NAD(P)-dependent oxidoreductase [Devosia sediminis]|uniref:SDR family NAD(P)-dependent oxidoreductase n=1 Tax=Devosia sediminis TaxID=2798801 RepID=UPI002E2B22E4|nr:SDR family oxidoreductase [Devosia sediminis]